MGNSEIQLMPVSPDRTSILDPKTLVISRMNTLRATYSKKDAKAPSALYNELYDYVVETYATYGKSLSILLYLPDRVEKSHRYGLFGNHVDYPPLSENLALFDDVLRVFLPFI